MSKNATLIDASLPANRIVGTAACPVCTLVGHDGDSCRASLGNDSRVSHVLCRRLSSQIPPTAGAIFTQPKLIVDLVADLISTTDVLEDTFTLTAVTEGSGEGAVAQGFGPDDILTTVGLVNGDVRVQISYTGNTLKAAEKPGVMIGEDYGPLVSRIPEEADQAAQKLVAAKFTLVQHDIGGSRPSLTFVRGTQIVDPNKPGRVKANIGVSAVISWNN